MSRITLSFVFVAAAVLAIGLAANVQADAVLFADNFDGANTAAGNYGLNDNLAARQAAGLSSYSWGLATGTDAINAQVNSSFGANMLAFSRPATGYSADNYATNTAIIQHDFATDLATRTGFTVQFDLDPLSASTQTNHGYGAGVLIGGSNATGVPDGSSRTGFYDKTVDLGLEFNDAGAIWLFHDNGATGGRRVRSRHLPHPTRELGGYEHD